MLKLLTILGASMGLASPIVTSFTNTNYIENKESNIVDAENYIDITVSLPGADLGLFASFTEAETRMQEIISDSGNIVTVDSTYQGLFILRGDETMGYTGISLYEYRLPEDITSILGKLPGAYLGVFQTKEEARAELDQIILDSEYSVTVDDSQDGIFTISGIEAEGFVDSSQYTYKIDEQFIDIRDQLPGAYLGFFQTKEAARARMDSMILRTGYTVIVDDTMANSFKLSGDESAGYTGQSVYSYELYETPTSLN